MGLTNLLTYTPQMHTHDKTQTRLRIHIVHTVSIDKFSNRSIRLNTELALQINSHCGKLPYNKLVYHGRHVMTTVTKFSQYKYFPAQMVDRSPRSSYRRIHSCQISRTTEHNTPARYNSWSKSNQKEARSIERRRSKGENDERGSEGVVDDSTTRNTKTNRE